MTTHVGDVMHRGVVTCAPETTLGEAAALLVENAVHALVVEDGAEPLGVLADYDLLAGEWLATDEDRLAALRTMRAGELMTSPPLVIEVSATAAEAARRLHEARVGRLVVVEDGRAIGVVSTSDLVATLASTASTPAVVEDVMTRAFVACRADTPIHALARAMTERHVRSVVVLGLDGAAQGVVTGTDLLPLVAGSAAVATAADLMHEPLTVDRAAPLHEAAALLVRLEVHRLVVVDERHPGGPPLGVLSTWDVLAEMSGAGSRWR